MTVKGGGEGGGEGGGASGGEYDVIMGMKGEPRGEHKRKCFDIFERARYRNLTRTGPSLLLGACQRRSVDLLKGHGFRDVGVTYSLG